jgi:hypothetical protein
MSTITGRTLVNIGGVVDEVLPITLTMLEEAMFSFVLSGSFFGVLVVSSGAGLGTLPESSSEDFLLECLVGRLLLRAKKPD